MASADSPGRRPSSGFHEPIVPPGTPAQEIASTSFADLLRMLAQGVADAQAALDRSSAELVEELASTYVPYVPEIREIIEEDGRVRYEQGPTEEVSLLDLGVTPAFYQFSEAKMEVAIDISVVEETDESAEAGGEAGRTGLRAGTAALRAERKLQRDLGAHSKLTATLVPVPMPIGIKPMITRVPAEDA